ncbi:hypothetical protein CVT26_012913 [Gymnopilus dilepis]|uniref:Uncharacterized protein n=1 Tax=Gymnopilus dilepis TaxID=231916 RepID=A0A409Y496_9AGAR|nr:hypothetical protein CVT26_012913 [Gymnopilus dilepis]
MAPLGSQKLKAVVKGSRCRGPPGLRHPMPLKFKTQHEFEKSQRALRKAMHEFFPVEVRDIVLEKHLKALQAKPSGASYEEFLNFPPFFRRSFGKRGTINLTSDTRIEKFILDSFNFRSVFGHRGITFRDVYCLQTVLPSSAALFASLGAELSFSAVTHLSIHCGLEPDFLKSLKQWDMVLGRLEVLRIKYMVFVDEVEDEEMPWENPLWIEVLGLCLNMRVFLLKTPLPVSRQDDWSCQELVPIWASNLPKLQRVYIFHAYDESCDVGDFLWQGSNVLHTRSAYGSNIWESQHVRPKDFCARLPFRRLVPYTTVPPEDVDVYDSDDCWAPDDGEVPSDDLQYPNGLEGGWMAVDLS